MLEYLKRCIASVKDQGMGDSEHIIVDGASCDGTAEWLSVRPGLQSINGKDDGMYDALNKGFDRGRGEIFGFLNCDEQYLPGTLKFVTGYFADHPGIDVLFGDALLIRPDGSHLAYRKGIPPRRSYILASHLYLPSCAMFFRAKAFAAGHRFDVRFRNVFFAHMAFVVTLLEYGLRVDTCQSISGRFHGDRHKYEHERFGEERT